MKKFLFVAGVFYLFMVVSCKKQYITYPTPPPLSDYYPLQVGKYITYEVDSIGFPNGTRPVTDSCEIMYVIAAQITDNLGRPAYSIDTYIRHSPNGPWVSNSLTDMAVNTGGTIEFYENNLRYLKLEEPIANGFSWQGNIYIDTDVPEPVTSTLPNLNYLDNWNYTYDSLNMPVALGPLTVDSTISVTEEPYTITGSPLNGNVVTDTIYSGIDYSYTKYAKGIGMVYHNFLHQIWQPTFYDPTTHALLKKGSYDNVASYGVTMTIIDHN